MPQDDTSTPHADLQHATSSAADLRTFSDMGSLPSCLPDPSKWAPTYDTGPNGAD